MRAYARIAARVVQYDVRTHGQTREQGESKMAVKIELINVVFVKK